MSDPRTVRLVALLIGCTALAAVVGTIVLLTQGKEADAALAGLAGTALGYLAGVLTPASGGVQQPPGRPVPTVEAHDHGHGRLDLVTAVLVVLTLVLLGLLLLRMLGVR